MKTGWRCKLCGHINGGGRACASCEKRKPRVKAPPPPPSFRAWACVILALDPATVTGWAIWVNGVYHRSGEFELWSGEGVRECVRVIDIARDIALSLNIPWCVQAERSFGGHMGRKETAALGFWRFGLYNAQLLPACIGLVYPARWRARVLPKGNASAKRKIVKSVEVAIAKKLTSHETMGDDEAAAVGIGKWSTQAGETALLLPERLRVTI